MLKTQIKDGKLYAAVKDLRNWQDNPKDVMQDDFARLHTQLDLGEHSALLVTSDGEVLGGNTRLRAYQQAQKQDAKIILIDIFDDESGTRARVDGVLAERVFDSPQQAKIEYALSHNDMVGAYNDDKLSQLLQLFPVSTDVYKVINLSLPVEQVVLENSGFGNNLDERDTDSDHLGKSLDTFLNGSVKQIVFYFDNDQYDEIVAKLEQLRKAHNKDNNSDLFLQMVEELES